MVRRVLVRMVRVAPDVPSIARALVDQGPCAVLHSSMRGGKWGRWSYVCVGGHEVSRIDVAPSDLLPWFPCFVGVLPYESHRFERPSWSAPEDRPAPLFVEPRWLRFDAVVGIDHLLGDVIVCARDPASLRDVQRRLARPASRVARPVVRLVSEGAPERHAARVRRAKELIAAGHVYQVNLARPLRLAIDDVSARALAELSFDLARAAPTPFAAMIHLGDRAIVSTSPELLLDVGWDARGVGTVLTEPIKGTRARGHDAATDRALALELDADPKERAELAMIVDVERNDLNRVAVPGSVHVVGAPEIATFGRVHHRVASIRARLRQGVGLDEIFRALLPSGSVTGAPKIRAMEVIRALEDDRRGLYTGGFGFVSSSGGARLAMAIRTLEIGADGSGVYFTGGGIVADSDPDREVEETRWKAAQLVRVLARA
jgi:anthranilate/para-aminobenzoate synthase component I